MWKATCAVRPSRAWYPRRASCFVSCIAVTQTISPPCGYCVRTAGGRFQIWTGSDEPMSRTYETTLNMLGATVERFAGQIADQFSHLDRLNEA